MGARRFHHRRPFVPLFLEPLEDRLLLSTTGITEQGVVVLYSVVNHSVSQSQSLLPNDSVTPPFPLSTEKSPQDDTGNVSQDEVIGPTGVVTETSVPHASISLPIANPGASLNGNGIMLYPIPSPHPTMNLDARSLDRDDSYLTMGNADDHALSHQVLFQQYLSPSVTITEVPDGAPGVAVQSLIPSGGLQPPGDVLSAAGLGTAQLARVAPPLPEPATSPPSEEAQRYPERDEGKEMTPPMPDSQPLVLPPPTAASDIPPPDSSPGDPFADFLPIDVEAIQRSADAFFQQLAHLSDEWNDVRVIHKWTPWLLIAGVAAYEWVRLRRIRRISFAGFEENHSHEPTVFLAGDEE